MKNLYAFLAAVSLSASPLISQQVITSIANGNATSPFTWSCTCVPTDGDLITVNHAVVMDVDYAYTMGSITISSGASLTGNAGNRIFGVSGGSFVNNGTVSIGYIVHNGGTFTNNNIISGGSGFLIDQTATTVNTGVIIAGDSTYINTNASLQSTGTFTGGIVLSAGTINTTWDFNADDMLNTGTVTSSGAFHVTGSLYNTGTMTLNGWNNVSGDVWNAENMTVNYFLTTQSLYNGDSINGTATFTNNGTVSIANSFFNSEDVNGIGDFCVTDTSWNAGVISGSVDICDQTGGGWDLNSGTEAGTVTHCAAGPCTIGIGEELTSTIGISPNPSNEIIKLELAQAEFGVVEVIDVTGRVVMREDISGKEVLLNVLQLPEGMYSVVVRGESQNYTGRFIKQ